MLRVFVYSLPYITKHENVQTFLSRDFLLALLLLFQSIQTHFVIIETGISPIIPSTSLDG